MKRKTKLQRSFEKLQYHNGSNGTMSSFKEALQDFGLQCFIKAEQGKLFELTYNDDKIALNNFPKKQG